MKKIILTPKEYANICLQCPFERCQGTYTGCPRTRPYKTIEVIHNESKNKEILK